MLVCPLYYDLLADGRTAVALSFLGYSAAVMRHARRVVWSLVTSYPRLIATYACVTMAFSVFGTRAARSTDVFFDAVRCAVRLTALFIAFHASRSVAVGLLFAVGFGVAQWGSHLGAVVTLVASRMPLYPEVKRVAAARAHSSRATVPDGGEHKEQAATATPAAGLVETRSTGAGWRRTTGWGARAAESDDEDGSDY